MKSSTEDTALVSSAPPFIVQLVLCMLSDKNVLLKKKSDTVSEPQLERNTQALLPSCRPQASAGLCAVTCPFHDRKTHTLGERLASPPKKKTQGNSLPSAEGDRDADRPAAGGVNAAGHQHRPLHPR